MCDVSVIMPVYNGEKYIREAIDSVLGQTYENFELILIDDASTDRSIEFIKNYNDPRIILIQNKKNMGIAMTRNIGIRNAQGKYIAFLDDDDIACLDRLEKQVEAMEKSPQNNIVAGRYINVNEFGEAISDTSQCFNNPKYIKASMCFVNLFCNCEFLLRKSFIQKHSISYREHQFGMEDYMFWIECLKYTDIVCIDELVLKHRQYRQNTTNLIKEKHIKERIAQRKRIQEKMLSQIGVILEEDKFEIFYKYNNENCNSIKELKLYYAVLNEIVRQCRFNELDCSEEMEIICRKYLARQVRYMNDIWS